LKELKTFAWWLVILGGANWGVVGLGNLLGGGNWNVVHLALASWKGLADYVYLLTGAAALYLVWDKVNK
jgi:uncharacterized membrane protein YuzA (DUF378 family)